MSSFFVSLLNFPKFTAVMSFNNVLVSFSVISPIFRFTFSKVPLFNKVCILLISSICIIALQSFIKLPPPIPVPPKCIYSFFRTFTKAVPVPTLTISAFSFPESIVPPIAIASISSTIILGILLVSKFVLLAPIPVKTNLPIFFISILNFSINISKQFLVYVLSIVILFNISKFSFVSIIFTSVVPISIPIIFIFILSCSTKSSPNNLISYLENIQYFFEIFFVENETNYNAKFMPRTTTSFMFSISSSISFGVTIILNSLIDNALFISS